MGYAVLAAILLAQLPVERPPHFTTGTISGTVADETGKPLAWVCVLVLGTRMGTMTQPDGSFRLAHVPAGAYKLRAMLMGFRSLEKDGVAVVGGETTRVIFELMALWPSYPNLSPPDMAPVRYQPLVPWFVPDFYAEAWRVIIPIQPATIQRDVVRQQIESRPRIR